VRTLLIWAATIGLTIYFALMFLHHMAHGQYARVIMTGKRGLSPSFWFLTAVITAVLLKIWLW
jgi:hypothetical protein